MKWVTRKGRCSFEQIVDERLGQGLTDVARDDLEITQKAVFLYDSLYAHLKRQEKARH